MPTKLHPSTIQTIRVELPINLALLKVKGKGKGPRHKAGMSSTPNLVTPPQSEVVNAVMEAPCAPVLASAPPLAGLLFPNGL